MIRDLFGEVTFPSVVVPLEWDEVQYDRLPGRDEGPRNQATQQTPDKVRHAFLHGATRLPSGEEALLVDTGAVDNASGGDFVYRQKAEAEKHGHQSAIRQLERPKRLSGVGDEAKPCTHQARVPGVLRNGEMITYEAPILPGSPSPVPPLYGLGAMAAENVFLGTRPGTSTMAPIGREGEIIVYASRIPPGL